MWTCPRCGKTFKNTSQSHSCGDYTEAAFLAGKTEKEIQLYEGLKHILRGLGLDVRLSPAKTRIGFITTVTFAAVNRLGHGKLCGHILLRSARTESKKFIKIEGPMTGWYVHHFCFEDPNFFDDEMMVYLRESYRLGSRPG